MSALDRSSIVTMKVDVCNLTTVVDFCLNRIKSRRGAYICVSNVHMCMETYDSPDFRNIVNHADLVIPDGRPIYWAQRLLGNKSAEQVRGQDITQALCKLSHLEEIKIGLYGGSSEEVLERVKHNLRAEYRNIKIVYSYSPPYRALSEEEIGKVTTDIRNAEVDVLLVGIGCPKQELWMAQQKDKVNAVMLGVGAVFDFVAGTKSHAPKWMQIIGLEWFYRLCAEPKRLWRRYLKQNPRYIWHVTCQVFFKRNYL